MLIYEDSKKIGMGLIVIGFCCFIIGVTTFLNRGFLIIGNISFLMGITALIGPAYTLQFFIKKSKI